MDMGMCIDHESCALKLAHKKSQQNVCKNDSFSKNIYSRHFVIKIVFLETQLVFLVLLFCKCFPQIRLLKTIKNIINDPKRFGLFQKHKLTEAINNETQ